MARLISASVTANESIYGTKSLTSGGTILSGDKGLLKTLQNCSWSIVAILEGSFTFSPSDGSFSGPMRDFTLAKRLV